MAKRKYLKPSEIPSKWQDVLINIPGYDSIATAGDCFFDAQEAKVALDFFPEMTTHVEGAVANKPFVLEKWQQGFVANLLGWKMFDEVGRIVRRYRETFLYVARKNGKTPIVSALGLLIFFCDNEYGQQCFLAAGDKEQAGHLFRHMKGMVDANEALSKRCQIYGGNATAGQSKSLVRSEDNSYLRVISADASGKHGGNTHLAIVDELHVQPNRDLVDVLQTSMASQNRKQPLLVCITTADYDRPSICNEKYEYACKVRDGVVPNNRFLPVIYEVPKDADWKDEANWKLANPNLGVSVSLDYLRGECKRAQEIPAYEYTFRRLHLNQRTSSADKCIPLEQWDACHDKMIDLDSLVGRECCAALDIGARSDFCALARLFPHDDATVITDENDPASQPVMRRSYTLLMDFWLPEKPVKRDVNIERDIEAWRKQGLIRTTPGNEVDYDVMFSDIKEILSPYYVKNFLFDRGFEGLHLGQMLQQEYGGVVECYPQTLAYFNGPFREFLHLLSFKMLHHDGNKVMRWMVSNVVAEYRAGLMKPSKDKSSEKIDGVTAALMSIAAGCRATGENWFSMMGGLRG